MTSSDAGYYDWLDFNNPMTEETANRLVSKLAWSDPANILDIGCGWGEMLLRLVAACPRAVGHGIDNNLRLIERAVANATKRSLTDRVRFSSDVAADAKPADLVLNIGAEHVFGNLDTALDALWPLVRPGGILMFGSPFWERPPTSEVEAFIGELPDLADLLEAAVAKGWRPLDLTVSSAEDWDRFEFGFLADWEQVVMAPPSAEPATVTPQAADGERDDARVAADRHRRAYLERRGTLGFAFLTLGRPS